MVVAPGLLGDYWRTNYDRRVYAISGSTYAAVMAVRPDARVKYFMSGGAEVTHYADTPMETLTPIAGGGWTYTSGSDEVETYDTSGRLVSLWDKNNQLQTLNYDAQGRLASVTDAHGRALTFAYTGSIQTYAGGTVTVTKPDGFPIVYTVGGRGNNNLLSVAYQNGTSRQYAYGNLALLTAVTRIIDENGVSYEGIDYDSSGRAIDSYLAPGVAGNTIERNNFAFNSNGTTTIVDPLGNSSTWSFSNVNGVYKLAGKTLCDTCGTNAAAESRLYDAAGYPQSKSDFNGAVTNYTYDDARGLEIQRVEGSGSSRRTINTLWDANFRVPDQRSILNTNNVTEALTKWSYNTRGQVLARCVADPAVSGATSYTCGSATNAPTGVRQWKYTYCDSVGTGCPIIGLLKTVDGPRIDASDVTTYAYYQTTDVSGCSTLGGACHYLGDLQSVTNALGHVTTYVSYDKNGRVTRAQDANGTFTDMTYHARGWLLTRTVRANANGTPNSSLDATTTFAYDGVGNVTQVTQPDGAYLHYVYDAAHRLTDVYDSLVPSNYLQGNRIHYTLDAAGNRTTEDTKDPSGAIKRTVSRQYDQLNRLLKALNASNAVVQQYQNPSEAPPTGISYNDGYDGNGNAIYSVDGNSVGTEQQYDPLNRLVKTLQDHAGIGATHDTATQYAYDTRDNLRSVTDPDNLVTNYTYDGLNNLTALQSPDSGNTGYTYDAAGNRKTQTDARGITATYSYDALNRLSGISYPTSALNVAYSYDQPSTGCYNVGRLTTMTDSSGSTAYCYDRRGNVLQKTQITKPDSNVSAVTQWAYGLADRVTGMTYPSGLQLSYARNSIGQVTQITYTTSPTATAATLISAASYYPFGPPNAITFANGGTLTRTFDQDYAIDKIVGSGPNGLVLDATVDRLGNLVNASNTLGANPPTQSYQYDPLYRLKEVDAGTSTLLQTYTYSMTGDRTGRTTAGQAAQSYTYTPNTHRLATVAGVARTYDASGNTTSDGVRSYAFDNRNRLTSATSAGSTLGTYQFNGRGERVRKNALDFAYDESGRLIAEYSMYQPPPGLPSCDPEIIEGCTPNPAPVVPGTDYIYLDNLPVAVVQWGPPPGPPCLSCTPTYVGTLYYVQTDQLGTPREVIQPGATTANDTVVWKWDYFANNSAFGENTPSVQTITFNLRFPGQYFDVETGLNYNYFRDYEPGTGRYVESDPIGLRGGISTYGYVGDKPLRSIDPRGLSSVDDFVNCMARNATREMPLNCYDTLFAEAQGSIEIFRAGCSAVNHGLECFTTCYIKAFFGPDLTEAAENGAKAAVAKALEEMAKTTMEKRLKDLVPVILAADTANDVYGTIKCTTTCIKN